MPGGSQHATACSVVDRRGKLTMLPCRGTSAVFSRRQTTMSALCVDGAPEAARGKSECPAPGRELLLPKIEDDPRAGFAETGTVRGEPFEMPEMPTWNKTRNLPQTYHTRAPNAMHVRWLTLYEMLPAVTAHDVRMATSVARASQSQTGSGHGPWGCAVVNACRKGPELPPTAA